MIRKADECKVEIREHMRDGDGQVQIQHFVDSAELYEKGRLFARLTLEPGCSIGFHSLWALSCSLGGGPPCVAAVYPGSNSVHLEGSRGGKNNIRALPSWL